MRREELGMSATSNADLQYVLPPERLIVDQRIERDGRPRHESTGGSEESAIDLLEIFFRVLLGGDLLRPVVTHRVAFPPFPVGILPSSILLAIGGESGGAAEAGCFPR